MLGMCIYITIAILPLYYQEILGYTAFTAGLVVVARHWLLHWLAVIGFLGSRIDHRKLLCAGIHWLRRLLALFFGMVNLDIGPYTLLIPITLTGFALSFVFVPLATMATSTIPREEMGNATGLFNMLRNIGGSIGISMATTAPDPEKPGRPEALGGIVGRVEAARHFLPLAQRGLVGAHVVIVNAGRRHHALVVVTIGVGIELRRLARVGRVNGLGELDRSPVARGEIIMRMRSIACVFSATTANDPGKKLGN